MSTPQVLMDSSRTVSGGVAGSLSAHAQGATAECQGRAKAQFTGLYHQWQTSARQLHEALLGIR